MMRQGVKVVGLFAALWALSAAGRMESFARGVPDRMSYQGVQRNAAGAPLDGNVEMVFRFFDAPTGGSEILVDAHQTGGAGPVAVSNGLFQVELGSGVVTDGSGTPTGDPFTTLVKMFSVIGDVWMQVDLSTGGPFETLSPRTHVVAAAYALRAASAEKADTASTVGGVLPTDILTTSAVAQTKAGALQIDGTLTAGGNTLSFGQGSTQVSSASNLIITSGNANSDDLYLRGGNSAGDGSIEILGLGPMNIRSGSGNVSFLVDPTAFVTATLDPTGTFTATDDLVAGGGEVRFGSTSPSASITATATQMTIRGGDIATDDLLLSATLDPNQGSLDISGGSGMVLRSGGGSFQFDGPGGSVTANVISPPGAWTVSGDIVAGGNDLRFASANARISTTDTTMNVIAGNAATDSLKLQVSDIPGDGGISITGGGPMELTSNTGIWSFNRTTLGPPDVEAYLDSGGLTLDGGLTTSGPIDITAYQGRINFLTDGADIVHNGLHELNVTSNTHTYDILGLHGGNSDVRLIGGGPIVLRTPGDVEFRSGSFGGPSFLTGTMSPSGTFRASQDLVAARDLVSEGWKMYLGADRTTWMERNPTNDHVFIARDQDNNHTSSQFIIFTNAGTEMQMRIDDGADAPTSFDGPTYANGLDYAEAFRITDLTLKPGEVVVFDPSAPGYIARAAQAYSTLIAGVISGDPGFVTGNSFDAEEAADPAVALEMKSAFAGGDYARGAELSVVLQRKKTDQQRPVALAGRLPVKVDPAYGPIHAGDHLTSSATPGHAMAMRGAGPSLGVALEGWEGPGPGAIMAFVQRGHYTPPALLEQAAAAQESLAASLESRTADPQTGIQRLASSLQVVLDAQGEDDARFSVFRDGDAAEPRAEVFRVDERGNVWAQGAFRPRSMDLAEILELGEPAGPGDVLTMDPEDPDRCILSRAAADRAVVGVVASDPGVLLGGDMSRLLSEEPELAEALAEARAAGDRRGEQAVWTELEARFRARHAAVALSGTVMVKVDASWGAIEPGDLLIASPTPGHAMRAPDPVPEGAVIGKAMGRLDRGEGLIRMIVMLR